MNPQEVSKLKLQLEIRMPETEDEKFRNSDKFSAEVNLAESMPVLTSVHQLVGKIVEGEEIDKLHIPY